MRTKQGSILKKYARIVAAVVCITFVGTAYQNCSQPATNFEGSGGSFSSLSSEDDLFAMLQEGRSLSALLNGFDVNADVNSDVLRNAPTLSKLLMSKVELIEKAINVDHIPTNSAVVLKEVDSLVNLLAQARDVQVAYDSIRRDKLLSLRIDAVETSLNQAISDLAALGGAFNQFKSAITARVDGLVEQMTKWEIRADNIDKAISDLAAKGKAEDLALKAALTALKGYTETELASVKQKGQDLENELKDQAADANKTKAQIAEAQAEMARLGDISNRLCKYDGSGAISDARAQCTNSSQSNCCLTVNVIDCSSLFAAAPAALNQCNLLITVIKNHDQQLQAIQAVDEKQNKALESIGASIDGIVKDITSINKSVSTLAEGIEKVQAVTTELANQIGSIKDTMKANDDFAKAELSKLNMRTALLEFKANRSEVISGLQARANATLAWATLRYAQVNQTYCVDRRNQALAMFDYRSARQNIEFCLEKRGLAVLAQTMASVANAYAGMLGSLNVDTECSEKLKDGRAASSLSDSELMVDGISEELTSICKTGGQVVARSLMLNIARYLKQIGPDFRTYEAMGSASKAVNLILLGKEWSSTASVADKSAFNDIDPTGDRYKNTPYGQVERLFVYNYIATAFRDVNGKFITDPTKVNVNVSGSTFTEKQILQGAQVGKNLPEYVQRVRLLEAQGYCSDCGFKVTGRINPDSNKSSLVIAHGDGKSRFFYPNDPRSDQCPVNDDIVIRHSDGKHYLYHVSFDTWGNDILVPGFIEGFHGVVANSDADMEAGNFAYCGPEKDVRVERAGLDAAVIPTRIMIRATRPYGNSYGRPLCTKLTAVCAVRQNEWVAPASVQNMSVADIGSQAALGTFTRYLTGFNSNVINAMCSVQTPAIGAPAAVAVNSRNIASIAANRGVSVAWSNPDGSNASSVAQSYVALDSTQLIGAAYWPFQDGPLPYTSEKISFGQTKSFAMPSASSAVSTTNFIREVASVGQLKAEECSHCPANLKMLGGCAVIPPTPPASN